MSLSSRLAPSPAGAALPGSERPLDWRIEALRGGAALLVVLAHYGAWLGLPAWGSALASTGVDLFFVLSGLVFAPYLLRSGWGYGAHLVRRLFRLYPLYLLALAVYVALKWPAPDATAHLGTHLLMLHTLGATEVAFFYNPAFWSLPPELSFYLLLPAVAWAVQRFGLATVLLAAVAARLALLLPLPWALDAAPALATALRTATVHLPGVLCEFLFGAWVWQRVQTAGHRAGPALAVAVLGALLTWLVWRATGLAAGAPGLAAALGGLVGLAAAAAYAALVLAAVAVRWQPRALPALALWAGQLSYGVYLLHNAAPVLLQRLWPGLQGPALAGAALALTLLAAWLAHHAVEQPLRDWGRRLSRRPASRS